ncbi:MAG: hypothetical protein NC217_05775 [Muribaculaceae bacterium]|nr:hypothetical protein [Muribaculaceae bacterium]
MIKKIFAVAVIALSSISISAMAQDRPGNCKGPKCDKQEQCSRPAPGNKKSGKKDRLNPFQGIELTAEQQAKLDNLKKKDAEQRDKNKEKVAKERKERMEKHDKEIKNILTPAQYQQYEANKQAMKDVRKAQKDGKKDMRAKGHKGHKGPKGGPRHNGKPAPDCKSSCNKPGQTKCDSLPAPGK